MQPIDRLRADLRNEAYSRACDGIDADLAVQRLATATGEFVRALGHGHDYDYRLEREGTDLDALTKALGHEPTWREGLAFQRCVRAFLCYSAPS